MAVTIKKISELAGVSIGTVDRALHNRGRVDPAVARRIQNIAQELNYHPNSVARSLATRKKIIISVILHIQNINTYFRDVISGIEKYKEEIRDFGVTIDIITCPDFDAAAQLACINNAIAAGSNALVIVPINNPMIQARLKELNDQHFPVVFLTNILKDADYLSFVGCNYRLIGQLSAGILNMISPSSGKLLLFSPSFQMYGHTLRMEGLTRQLTLNYPHIILSDVFEMTGNEAKNYQITKLALEKYPDTNLFVCPGPYSKGNLQAIEDCGYFKKSKILCYDYSDEIGEEIRKNNIAAIITQNPQLQGYTAVKTCFEYIVSNKPPRFHDYYISSHIIIKENLSEIERIREEYQTPLPPLSGS